MLFIHYVNKNTSNISAHLQQHLPAAATQKGRPVMAQKNFQQPYVYSQAEKPRYVLNRSYPKSVGGSSARVSWQRWRHARSGGKQSQSTQVKSRDQMCLLLHKRQLQVRDDFYY